MKKRILSFIFAIFLLVPCMFFVGCGNTTPNDPASPPDQETGTGTGEGNSGSSGSGEGAKQDTISTLYDMRVVSYKIGDYQAAQLIWLPDGKTMLIDPYLVRYEYDFRMFYMQFTNDSKYDQEGYLYIDYLVVTNTNKIYMDMGSFFNAFRVGTYYRPDMGIDLEKWRDYLSGDDSVDGLYMDDYFSISQEHLTGRSTSNYQGEISFGANDGKPYCEYNEKYLESLYYAELFGTNIVKLQNNEPLTQTFCYGGKDYTYTFDFYSPEPKIDSSAISTHYGFPVIDEYYQTAEFNTIISLNYGDFDLLYLDKATYNVLESFFAHHDETKKYDVWLGCYEKRNEIRDNLNQSYMRLFNEKRLQGEYLITKIFDKTKINTNILYFALTQSVADWNRTDSMITWETHCIYKFDPEEDRVLLNTNTYFSSINNSGVVLPIIVIQKDYSHSVMELRDKEEYINFLPPSIDGVIMTPSWS